MAENATRYAYEAGIDWVKQSSGWGKGGCAATAEDVRLLNAKATAVIIDVNELMTIKQAVRYVTAWKK